jgi:hypothetical protein
VKRGTLRTRTPAATCITSSTGTTSTGELDTFTAARFWDRKSKNKSIKNQILSKAGDQNVYYSTQRILCMNSASFLIFCKFTWWWPNIRAETCREYRRYIIKYFVNCCETEGIIIYG